MGAKYQPSVKDHKATLRFQRKQVSGRPSPKPAPKKATTPGKK